MTATRTELARRALAKAAEVRDRFGIPAHAAVNIFDLCGELFDPKIIVRFKDISMEGVYLRQDRPEIWLGVRPLTRRVFNCAHELGHHVFGHGSTLDQLQAEDSNEQALEPDEYLANTFAGFLLMPRLAVTSAFAAHGWKVEEATPERCFVVSCSLGVGYEALTNHMVYSLRLVSGSESQRILRTRLPAIREGMLGSLAPDRLMVIDTQHTLPTVDTEVNTGLLLPSDTKAENENLTVSADTPGGRLFRAIRPGITRVFSPEGRWAVLVRIMRDQYHGLSRYRHFPREDGDDE